MSKKLHTGLAAIPTRHDYLELEKCDRFGDWIQQQLEQLEAEFRSFITRSSEGDATRSARGNQATL